MEHTERTIKDTPETKDFPFIYPYEYEQASRSYLMATAAIIAGLPLPVINLIASIGYYLGNRRSSYFVRWHCIQSIIGQTILIPFNSIALAWTIGHILQRYPLSTWSLPERHYTVTSYPLDYISGIDTYYWLYISFIILLNISEFIAAIATASRVSKGHNVRWWGIARITDIICSKEDRNPYKT